MRGSEVRFQVWDLKVDTHYAFLEVILAVAFELYRSSRWPEFAGHIHFVNTVKTL